MRMIHVRRHKRVTATGKTVTVRAHEREGDDGMRPVPEWSRSAYVGDVPAEAPPPQASDFWADAEEESLDIWADDAAEEQHARPTSTAEELRAAMAGELGALYDDFPAVRAKVDEKIADALEMPVRSVREERHAAEVDRMRSQMRDWRSRPEPQAGPAEPMTPQMAKLMGCDTPEGRARYERLRAYREAGYDGPLGPDNRIPDPDDPAEAETLSLLASLRL